MSNIDYVTAETESNRSPDRLRPRSKWLDLFLPRYLGRLAYLVRLLPLEFVILGTAASLQDPSSSTEGAPWIALFCLAATVYVVFGVMLPRARDVGWHPASIVVGFIPILGGVYGLALLLKPGIGHPIDIATMAPASETNDKSA